MKLLLFSFISFYVFVGWANDGAFYASGNHLIPLNETSIRVTKEVLKVERIPGDYLRVTVDYTFTNPSEAKKLLVGFEAPSPAGDVDGTPVNGKHPFISDFSVVMNHQNLPFKTAIVNSGAYMKNGEMNALTVEEVLDENFNENAPDFFYVYHFDADFKKGINTITHEYKFKLSSSIDFNYNFDYILSAATRWANHQIDDFTLIVDLGDFTEYSIAKTFFNDDNNWTGATKVLTGEILPYSEQAVKPIRVITNDNPIVFKKLNFKPEGELSIYSARNFEVLQTKVFDAKGLALPYNVDDFRYIMKTVDEGSYKILRNLPFARRGYVFKSPSIQAYYEASDWYSPNPDYVANINLLGEVEKKWLETMKNNHE